VALPNSMAGFLMRREGKEREVKREEKGKERTAPQSPQYFGQVTPMDPGSFSAETYACEEWVESGLHFLNTRLSLSQKTILI